MIQTLQSCVKQEFFCLRDSLFPQLAPSAPLLGFPLPVSPLAVIRSYSFLFMDILYKAYDFLLMIYKYPTIITTIGQQKNH